MNDKPTQQDSKTNLEPNAQKATSLDEIASMRIEALAHRSNYYGWKVSKSQILRVGPEEFEKHLKKQRRIIYKLRVVEEKAKLISLPFTFPKLPLASKDAEIFSNKVNNALKKIYKTQRDQDQEKVDLSKDTNSYLDFSLQTAAEKLQENILQHLEDYEITFEYSGLPDLMEQSARQLYFFRLHSKLKSHA